jgi:hypothetical protein
MESVSLGTNLLGDPRGTLREQRRGGGTSLFPLEMPLLKISFTWGSYRATVCLGVPVARVDTW